MRKWYIVFLLLIFFGFSAFCSEQISTYTEQKIAEMLTPHVALSVCDDGEKTLQKIILYEEELETVLPSVAVDLAQERLILQSLYLLQKQHYSFDAETRSPELRKQMKAQRKANEDWIDEHESEGVCKWMYLFTGDVTSYYMVRSLPATIRYGMRVKHLYEKALDVDAQFSYAHINLGNWLYYAPKIFGGGVNKAAAQYQAALDGARMDKERYVANIDLSQYWFEKKNMQKCAEYLLAAERLFPDNQELALIRKVNNYGKSLFQYNRDQSGIDEELQEAEKDEDDR